MSITSESALAVVKANLHEVFEETNPSKRKAAIERLWVPSNDALFVDPDNIFHGHDAIDGCVAGLVERFAGWVFVEHGKFLFH